MQFLGLLRFLCLTASKNSHVQFSMMLWRNWWYLMLSRRLYHMTDSIRPTAYFDMTDLRWLTWLWVWLIEVKYHYTKVLNHIMLLNFLLYNVVGLDMSPSPSSICFYWMLHQRWSAIRVRVKCLEDVVILNWSAIGHLTRYPCRSS